MIWNYLNCVSINDIKDYALKENVFITDKEAELILNFLKENFDCLYKGDESVFKKIRPYLSDEVYNTGLKLYKETKKKYLS